MYTELTPRAAQLTARWASSVATSLSVSAALGSSKIRTLDSLRRALGNFDQLALTHAEIGDGRARADVDAPARQQLVGVTQHAVVVDRAEA